MISASIRSGYTPISGVCYPIDVTNGGTVDENVSFSDSFSEFSNDSIIIGPGQTGTVYAVTHAAHDDISVAGTNTVVISVDTVAYSGPEYGDASYIQIFEIPGGEETDIIPTMESLYLRMRHGKYFIAPGQLKIWRQDTL